MGVVTLMATLMMMPLMSLLALREGGRGWGPGGLGGLWNGM